jgi:hypothetical protein
MVSLLCSHVPGQTVMTAKSLNFSAAEFHSMELYTFECDDTSTECIKFDYKPGFQCVLSFPLVCV